MLKNLGIFLICALFLLSHVAEAAQCCPDGDLQETITQSLSSHGHISSSENDSHDKHDECDLSCYHCHHAAYITYLPSVHKISIVETLHFGFSNLRISKFNNYLLRPPAIS